MGNVTVSWTDPDDLASVDVVSAPAPSGRVSSCQNNPKPGIWTYSVSSADSTTVGGTVTVTECHSQTINIDLPNTKALFGVLLNCEAGRAVTIKDPSGVTAGTHSFAAGTPVCGNLTEGFLTLDLSGFTDGQVWTAEAPPLDSGFTGPVVPFTTTTYKGCRSFFPGAVSLHDADFVASGYVTLGATCGCCSCHSYPDTLTYSDDYGFCSLTWNGGSWSGSYTFSHDDACDAPCPYVDRTLIGTSTVGVLIVAECNALGGFVVTKYFRFITGWTACSGGTSRFVLCGTPPVPVENGGSVCAVRGTGTGDCSGLPTVDVFGTLAEIPFGSHTAFGCNSLNGATPSGVLSDFTITGA